MPTLSEISGLDFQEVTRWKLEQIRDASGADVNIPLDLRCESIELPKKTFTANEVNIRGHKSKLPGIATPGGSLPVTFIETEDNTIKDFIREHKEKYWNDDTGVSESPSESKQTWVFAMEDRSGNVIYRYKIIGVWVEDWEMGTLDGSTSDYIKPSVTISYDDYREGQNP